MSIGDPSDSTICVSRDLFGGAITADLPQNWVDASDFRQVPDTQEVLLDRSSANVSCIVEVLEAVRGDDGKAWEDDLEALKFHFSSIAHDNAALTSTISSLDPSSSSQFSTSTSTSTSTPTSTPTSTSSPTAPQPHLMTGYQTVRKFNSAFSPGEPDRVKIHLALWRLKPTKDVDLVMTWNEPILIGDDVPPGAAVEQAEALQGQGQGNPEIERIFKQAARSLRIVDWNLFG